MQIPALFSKSRKGSAWSREAFIDMRRRLQNMPEAIKIKRTSQTGGSKTKKTQKSSFRKPKSESQLAMPAYYNDTDGSFYDPTTKNSLRQNPIELKKTSSPAAHLQQQHKNLNWWQIVLAVGIALLGIIAVTQPSIIQQAGSLLGLY